MIFASVPVDLHIPPSPTQQITAISLSLEPGDNAVAMATMMFAQMNWVQLSRASQEGWLDSDLSRDLPAQNLDERSFLLNMTWVSGGITMLRLVRPRQSFADMLAHIGYKGVSSVRRSRLDIG